MFSIIKVFLKNFAKKKRNYSAETTVQVHSCAVVVHVRTAASGTLGYPYVEIGIHIEEMQFSPAFWYSFVLN